MLTVDSDGQALFLDTVENTAELDHEEGEANSLTSEPEMDFGGLFS